MSNLIIYPLKSRSLITSLIKYSATVDTYSVLKQTPDDFSLLRKHQNDELFLAFSNYNVNIIN